MKISCPACAAKYSIADEKVQDRLAKIRCRKCGTTIVIDGKVSPPQVTAAAPGTATTDGDSQVAPESQLGVGAAPTASPAAGSPSPGEYSVDMGDNDQRTMRVDQIVQAYGRGELSAETYVWADGMSDWQRIADVGELSAAVAGTAAKVPEPFGLPRAATRTGAGRGSAADLFGGIESAGSEEDVTTSAPEPAPLAAAAAATTGARNESSVLFSLSALTGGPTPPTPTLGGGIGLPSPSAPMRSAPTASSSSREDSGLIDLKALTSAINAPGGSDGAAGYGGGFGGGGFPGAMSPLGLGAPPIGMPLGGVASAVPAADDMDTGRSKGGNKNVFIIAGAIVLVGLAGVGAFVLKGGDAPVATPTDTPRSATASEPASPAVVSPAAQAEEATAAPPPTGTSAPVAPPSAAVAAEEKPAATAPAARAISGTSAPRPRPSTATAAPAPVAAKPAPPAPQPAAEEPKPKKPAKKKCDCKPSDLMCAMRCSAK